MALLTSNGIDAQEILAPRKHNELVLELAEALMDRQNIQRKDLTAIAFGRGPGAFTGVRIATSITQGIAFALSLPVIAVSTLEILAQRVFETTDCQYALPVMDARMQEVYWMVCVRDENGLARGLGNEYVQSADAVKFNMDGLCQGIGSGWQRYPDIGVRNPQVLVDDVNISYLPSARQLARLAQREWIARNLLTAENAQPVYIRNQIVKQK